MTAPVVFDRKLAAAKCESAEARYTWKAKSGPLLIQVDDLAGGEASCSVTFDGTAIFSTQQQRDRALHSTECFLKRLKKSLAGVP